MARTAQNIIDEIKANRYPWLTQTEALQYLNDTHKEIVSLIPPACRYAFTSPVSIAVVSGTREYALPGVLNQIERAELTIGATTTRLESTSLDNINQGLTDGNANDVWIAAASSTPTEYYLSVQSGSLYIGLNPIPNANGTLKLLGSFANTLLAAETVLPLLSDEVYIEGICFRVAKAKRRANDSVAYFSAYQALLKQNVNWILTLSQEFQDGSRVNPRLKALG